MTIPSAVTITEVSPRDGLQNEDRFFETPLKVELIEKLAATGLPRIEASSFVHPKAIPALRDAADVFAQLPHREGVTYIGLVPNERGAQNALAAGVDEIATVLSASESHNQSNVKRGVDESLAAMEAIAALVKDFGTAWSGYISTAFGCPYEGEVAPERVVEIAKQLAAMGVGAISLGDTIGIANPRHVTALVRDMQDALPEVPLRLHFHDTRGTALANVLAALQEGVDSFDGSTGGLGGCPYAPGASGNLATEDLVNMLHSMGIETGVDLAGLVEVARWIEQQVGRALPGRVKQTEIAAAS